MARGIDRSAHEGAITSGTIAVLANGIDEIYPPENESLYHQIAEQGLLITEMPFGTKPSPRLFPLRNRIIASRSKAVLGVEAALRSGSLITAREAGDRGIDVMAVPGSPLDPRSKGTNGLIREGAVLVQDIEDIMAVINQPARLETPPPPAFDSQPEKPPEISANTYQDTRAKLLKNLSHDPIAVDELCRWCHVSADIAQSVLLELELAGQVQRHSGNRVSRLILNE